jgi:hypothetical protein
MDTYAVLLLLLPIGLLAEAWSYRGIIFLGIVCHQLTRVLLIFGTGLRQMQLMQVTYAAASCGELVYLAYPYLAVDKTHFLKATVAVRASVHLGNAVGSALGEALESSGFSLRSLMYLSWAFTTAAVVGFFVLPPPQNSFDRSEGPTLAHAIRTHGPRAIANEIAEMFRLSGDFASPLAVSTVWWVFGTCAAQVFVNYYQVRCRCCQLVISRHLSGESFSAVLLPIPSHPSHL